MNPEPRSQGDPIVCFLQASQALSISSSGSHPIPSLKKPGQETSCITACAGASVDAPHTLINTSERTCEEKPKIAPQIPVAPRLRTFGFQCQPEGQINSSANVQLWNRVFPLQSLGHLLKSVNISGRSALARSLLRSLAEDGTAMATHAIPSGTGDKQQRQALCTGPVCLTGYVSWASLLGLLGLLSPIALEGNCGAN